MPRSPFVLAVLLALVPQLSRAEGPPRPSTAPSALPASPAPPATPAPVTAAGTTPGTTPGTAPGTSPAKPVTPAPPAPAASVPHPLPVKRVPPDQVIAVLGQTVTGPDGKPVGRLIDVLVDRDGKPQAAVIDFGGFMGVGSRKIAVHWNTLHFHPGNAAHPVVLDLLPAELRQAPRYKGANRPAPVLVEPHPKQPAVPAPPAGKPEPSASAPTAASAPTPAKASAKAPAPAAPPGAAPAPTTGTAPAPG